jgi:arginyl-tRNA synthetase
MSDPHVSDPQQVLAARVQAAIVAAFGEDHAGADPVIRPSSFADFQANAALPLAKKLGRRPREVADEIVANLDVAGIVAGTEVSGPGFINLKLDDGWIAAQLNGLDDRLGIPVVADPLTIVVDYSAPNIAKEMLAHHIRTTIVGDAYCRTAEFLGHHVIRQNHVGDWGTPFGMLVEHLLEVGEDSAEALLLVNDPNGFYQNARTKFEGGGDFSDRARTRVVALQAGDPETIRLWKKLMVLSTGYLHRVYERLQVTLTDADLAGESMYNDMLADVCDELERKGLAVMDEGALCVFLDGFKGREDKPLPLIIRKSDGGYGYPATDLAAIRYRAQELKADRAVYVVGAPQALHFKMIYETARLAGWLDGGLEPFHATIGNVLGADGKILRTRSGEPVKLMALIEEGIERAAQVVKDGDYDAATQADIAVAVGVGAAKYADLSTARDSEYIFDFDRMLALQGNTGPYLQYAVARIHSIFRRAGITPGQATAPIAVVHEDERALALKLLDFGQAIDALIDGCLPHKLAGYLYDLATSFSSFFEHCPVLKDGVAPDVRDSRLALCRVTLQTLTTGLDLLGVPTLERM